MEVQTSYLVPKQALGPLYEARQRGAAGCSGGFCWVKADGQLHFWRYREGSDARMRSLRLPKAVSDPLNPAARLFIAILQQPRSNAITVVACSSDGGVAAWLDANHMAEPITTQIATAAVAILITSFAAAPQDSGSGPLFMAAAGMPDGSWTAVQGSTQGLFLRHINKARAQQQEARGMLGKIGSVISWGYAEAFDPSAKMIKKTPSGRPVVDLHVAALDGTRLRVTVLTDACVECWLVVLGLRPSEQLLWSFQNLLAVRQASSVQNLRSDAAKPGFSSANLALGLGGAHLYVWLQDTTPEGSVCHFMQRLLVDETGQPVHDWFTHMQVLDTVPVPAATEARSHPAYQLACDPTGKACLCLLEGGGLVQCSSEGPHLDPEPKAGAYALNISPGFLAPEPKVQQLGVDVDAVAIAACDVQGSGVAAGQSVSVAPGSYGMAPGAALWALLSTTYGVLELAQHHAVTAATAGSAAQPGPLNAEQAQQVYQLLDTSVNQALLAQQQQQQQQLILNTGAALPAQDAPRPLLALVAALGRRLEAMGALAPMSNMVVLARYSTQLTDLLPKQWTEGSMTSSPGASFSEQLSEKASRHAALLDCLAESAVLYRLDPEVQRTLLANAEKLAVAMGILGLQAAVQAGVVAQGGQQGPEAELLLQVLHRAGQISASSTGTGAASAVLQPLELFYAQPSISTPALLQALAEAAQQVARQAEAGLTRPTDQGATALRSQVALLAEVLGTAVAACSSRQAQLNQAYKLHAAGVAAKLGVPGWLEDSEARGHMETMLLACQSLHAQPGQGPGASAMVRSLFGVTEVLLTAWAAAVAAAPAGSGKAAALTGYRAARGRHVPLLLREALQELQQGQGQGRQQQALLQLQQQQEGAAFLLQVEELCRLHHCYPQLYTLCRTLAALEQPGQPLSASPRLLTYLASLSAEEGAAPRDTLAAFVFQQLYEDGLHAELLLLPSSFQPMLKEFMKAHPQLLWLLLARAGDWAGAAAALSQTAAQCKADLRRHQRLVCLAKLSANAAGDVSACSAASSQLQLLEVQQKLRLAAAGQQGQGASGAAGVGEAVMYLPAVVDAALRLAQQQAPVGSSAPDASAPNSEAALLALEALASSQPDDRQANKSRWRLVWRQLLEVTDWAHLDSQHQEQQPSAAGLAGDLGALLETTPLYQGALACCGRGVFGFGAVITDSGPQQEVKAWLLEWCASGNKGLRVQTLVTTAFDLALTHYHQRMQQLQSPWTGVGGFSALDTMAGAGEDLMVM